MELHVNNVIFLKRFDRCVDCITIDRTDTEFAYAGSKAFYKHFDKSLMSKRAGDIADADSFVCYCDAKEAEASKEYLSFRAYKALHYLNSFSFSKLDDEKIVEIAKFVRGISNEK